jgi:uncharacterized protein (DUF2147 family)
VKAPPGQRALLIGNEDRVMARRFPALAMALLALLPPMAAEARQAPSPHAIAPEVIGTWINPRGSVKVQTGKCTGGSTGDLCGWVVWAAPQAQADARDSGVTRLIGTELLRGYRSAGPGRYRGEVYVPDMGRTFTSTIEQRGAGGLKISGCILGGLICKSQNWRRA